MRPYSAGNSNLKLWNLGVSTWRGEIICISRTVCTNLESKYYAQAQGKYLLYSLRIKLINDKSGKNIPRLQSAIRKSNQEKKCSFFCNLLISFGHRAIWFSIRASCPVWQVRRIPGSLYIFAVRWGEASLSPSFLTHSQWCWQFGSSAGTFCRLAMYSMGPPGAASTTQRGGKRELNFNWARIKKHFA